MLSVSLTSLPYPGVGDPKWGLLRACVLGSEILLKRQNQVLTKARSIAVCSALWSVIEVNGVQCFTSSSLSFSSEQLSSKGKKK